MKTSAQAKQTKKTQPANQKACFSTW